jgi:hypothetical protein
VNPVGGGEGREGDRPIVDRADYDPSYRPGEPIECEVCGGVMVYGAACKLGCRRCGYTRDCSDP